MNEEILTSKDGYIIRLAKKEDFTNYYRENFCPLDKNIVRLTGGKEEFSEEEIKNFFINSIEDKNRYFFLIIDPNKNIIGESIINDIDWNLKSGNFRICIFKKENHLKGLGSWATIFTRDFAFNKLNLHRLDLSVFSFNKVAQKVYMKAGFKKEGILKDSIKDGDKYGDEIIMAILENEWEDIKKKEKSLL